MAQDSTGSVQAELAADLRCLGVAQLVRVPVGQGGGLAGVATIFGFPLLAVLAGPCRVGLLDPPRDGLSVGPTRVSLARRTLRPGLAAVLLARLYLGLAVLALFGPEGGNRLAGLEQVLTDVQTQPGLEDLLCLATEGDYLAVPTPGGLVLAVRPLVAAGPVDPHGARGVEVNAPHDDDFAGAHGAVALELHHRRHLGPEEGKRGVHDGIGDGLDRL